MSSACLTCLFEEDWVCYGSSFLFVCFTLILSRPMSKNAISFFLREVISSAGAVKGDEGPPWRAHSIRGISTSATFCRTGRFPGCWSPQLGNLIQFLLRFILLGT